MASEVRQDGAELLMSWCLRHSSRTFRGLIPEGELGVFVKMVGQTDRGGLGNGGEGGNTSLLSPHFEEEVRAVVPVPSPTESTAGKHPEEM